MQIYPDMGVAAMLKNNWQDAEFAFASLSDRKPVSEDDDLIVLAAPDPQGVQHRHALPLNFSATLACTQVSRPLYMLRLLVSTS